MAIPDPDKRVTRFALSLKRHDLRILVSLLTGHTMLNRHLTVTKTRTDLLRPVCNGGWRNLISLSGQLLCYNPFKEFSVRLFNGGIVSKRRDISSIFLNIRGVRIEHFSYPTVPVPDDAYPYPYPTRAKNCYPTRPDPRVYPYP